MLKVSGEANETQISEALKRYSERAFFVREALFHLFSLTHVMEKTKPEILKVKLLSTDEASFPSIALCRRSEAYQKFMKLAVHMARVQIWREGQEGRCTKCRCSEFHVQANQHELCLVNFNLKGRWKPIL